jgi:hypothetical protein
MPITPKRGSFLHADSHCFSYSLIEAAISDRLRFGVVTVLISGMDISARLG